MFYEVYMNLDQLPYFIAIAECGSLTAAAEKVGVSRQALSQYLTVLREETGHELFTTIKRRFILTDSGRRYYDAAQEIMAILNRTQHSFSLLDTAPKAVIRIGVTPSLGTELMNKCMDKFNNAYPDLKLEIITDEPARLRDYAKDREIDFAQINLNETPPTGVQAFPIYRSEYLVAVSSFHARAHDKLAFDELPTVDFNDLKDEIFILFDKTTYHREIIQPLLDHADFTPTVAAQVSSSMMNKSLIQQGYGIGFMNYEPVNGIRYLRLKDPVYSYVYIVSAKQHTFSEPERYMIYLMSRQQTLYEIEKIDSEPLDTIYNEFLGVDYFD